MLNQVVLIGRLTQDPELRYTATNGVPVATFSIAVDRPFTSQQGTKETDFIPIVAWRKQAENCANYLRKGLLVAVSGRLQIRAYEGNDGSKRKVAEIVADQVRFLEWSKDAQSGGDRGDIHGNEMHISEDDVPF
ncbi:MAG: single-stranded DNA-binding protein [Dethiobacter sp.]|jgi:single-strand DNA-binding protein|nr:single-stranded DNA-binding protein [Dethiobacter sp.]